MPKNSFQDIIPPGKKSIRDIPLPSRKIPPLPAVKVKAQAAEPVPMRDITPAETPMPPIEPPRPPVRPPVQEYDEEEPRHSGKKSFFTIVVIIIVLGAIAVWVLTAFFSGATIKITVASDSKSIDISGSSTKDATSGPAYSVITLSKEGEMNLPGTPSSSVQKKASGTITIYNNYSAAPQQLIANTRFETPGGLIYRIQSAITVPGMTTANGTTTPGSVDATVIADVAGPSYNASTSVFTIPGFQSDAGRYKGFYAVTKTALSGGYVGTAITVTAAARAQAVSQIDSQLAADLTKEAQTQTPDSFVLYGDGIFVQDQSLPDDMTTSSSTLTIKENATLYGIVFNKDDLSQYLASQSDAQEATSLGKVGITNIQSLNFSIDNKSSFNPVTSTSLSFQISGTAIFLSQIDEAEIKQNLAGKGKNDIIDLLKKGYPEIESAQVIVRPFWRQTLPTKPSQITVDFQS